METEKVNIMVILEMMFLMMLLFHVKHVRETKITLQILPHDSFSENGVSCQYSAKFRRLKTHRKTFGVPKGIKNCNPTPCGLLLVELIYLGPCYV